MGFPSPLKPDSVSDSRRRDKWHDWVTSPRKGHPFTVRSLVDRMKSKLTLESTKVAEARGAPMAMETNLPVHGSHLESLFEDHPGRAIITTPAASTTSSSDGNNGKGALSEFTPPKRPCSTAPSEPQPVTIIHGSSSEQRSIIDEKTRKEYSQGDNRVTDELQETKQTQESSRQEERKSARLIVEVETSAGVRVEIDVGARQHSETETTTDEGPDAQDPEYKTDDDLEENVADEEYYEESDDEDEHGDIKSEDEMIPSREVEFLLENAEQTRLNDLAALQDEFDDEIQYIAHERDTLLREKMFWQTKFVTAIKGREKQRSRASSLTEDNSRLEAINSTLEREMGLIQDIIDKQFAEVGEIKSNCYDTMTQLTQACEVTRSYLDKAREENMKTAKELAILRKIVMKIRQPSKNLTEFSMHHDFQQTLEVNKELKDGIETQQEEMNKLKAQLVERDLRIEQLEASKVKLEDHLEYMSSFNARYTAKFEETSRALAEYQKSLSTARDKEARMKDRLALVYNKWLLNKEQLEVDLTECQAKLQLKDSMLEVLHQQNSTYLGNWKDSIGMLVGQSQGDELSSKLADCLQETLDRNEALEIELNKLREETLALLGRTLG